MNRLIRRDHHEVFDSILPGDGGEIVCSKDVVLDRFKKMRLHERNVLVRRGVENQGRRVLSEYLSKALHILDIADFRAKHEIRKGLPHLILQVKQGRFGELECHQRRGTKARDLAAQLRSY